MNDINIYQKVYFNWWRELDKTLFFIIISLFLLGLFFSLVSTSLIVSDRFNTNSYKFFLKHFIYISMGFCIVFFISYLNIKKLFLISKFLFAICFIALLLVPFVGIEVKGSKRWIELFFLPRFQPIEVLKPFTIVVMALVLSLESKTNLYLKYLYSFLILSPIILLLISQPDIGQTILIFATWLALIFVSGVNLILFFMFFGMSALILIYIIFSWEFTIYNVFGIFFYCFLYFSS